MNINGESSNDPLNNLESVFDQYFIMCSIFVLCYTFHTTQIKPGLNIQHIQTAVGFYHTGLAAHATSEGIQNPVILLDNACFHFYEDRVLLISILEGVGSVAFYITPHEQTQ